ncbi:hypothetical protein ACNKHU_19305 [Shigella flexneri]
MVTPYVRSHAKLDRRSIVVLPEAPPLHAATGNQSPGTLTAAGRIHLEGYRNADGSVGTKSLSASPPASTVWQAWWSYVVEFSQRDL